MTGQLMTLPEASRRYGLDPRGERLRRLLIAAERRTGHRIGVRLAGERRSQWRVTDALLRRYVPELFGSADQFGELQRLVRHHLRDVDRRAESVAADVARAECAVVRHELGEAIVEVAEGVGKLAARVAELERR